MAPIVDLPHPAARRADRGRRLRRRTCPASPRCRASSSSCWPPGSCSRWSWPGTAAAPPSRSRSKPASPTASSRRRYPASRSCSEGWRGPPRWGSSPRSGSSRSAWSSAPRSKAAWPGCSSRSRWRRRRALAFGGIGSAIALRTGNANVVQGLFPLVFVVLFLSTAYFPLDLMIEPAKTIAQYNPLSFIVEGIRDPIISGISPTETLEAVLAIAGIGMLGARC